MNAKAIRVCSRNAGGPLSDRYARSTRRDAPKTRQKHKTRRKCSIHSERAFDSSIGGSTLHTHDDHCQNSETSRRSQIGSREKLSQLSLKSVRQRSQVTRQVKCIRSRLARVAHDRRQQHECHSSTPSIKAATASARSWKLASARGPPRPQHTRAHSHQTARQ